MSIEATTTLTQGGLGCAPNGVGVPNMTSSSGLAVAGSYELTTSHLSERGRAAI